MTDQQPTGLCPNCVVGEIVEGRLLDNVGAGLGTVFRPKGRSFFSCFFRRDAQLNNRAYACSSCGMLWTFVDPRRLV